MATKSKKLPGLSDEELKAIDLWCDSNKSHLLSEYFNVTCEVVYSVLGNRQMYKPLHDMAFDLRDAVGKEILKLIRGKRKVKSNASRSN